jgi:DNA helicase HerA-like ATPase
MADILLGKGEAQVCLRLDRANRHGVIAGATGTGKTVTLQVLAEAFAAQGVPVFAADVKGDLSGIAEPATPSDKLTQRAESVGAALQPVGAPAIFWDLFAAEGHPVRATISEMGPLMLARLLDLNDAQEGVLNIAFHVADEEGLLLLDLDDLQAALVHIGENAKEIALRYGNVAASSVGTIQRNLLVLRGQGADRFFGEPALKLTDLMRTTQDGRGMVSILAADRLIESPRVYATFLLWLMSELFEQLPEVGDLDKPKLVFFFDEAHLLFRDTPKALLEKIEQVVRLVRSKGVGIWFVTQNPADIPETVLAQLGNRIQHALRAYTPDEQEGLRAAARSFRPNPQIDTAEAIQQLGVGEALVSVLDEAGAPTPVERTRIRPPNSRIGPITPDERRAIIGLSPVAGLYDAAVNRESAFELLRDRATQKTAPDEPPPGSRSTALPPTSDWEAREPAAEREPRGRASQRESRPAPRSSRQGYGEAFAKSMLRTIGSQVGRQLIRGVLGSLTRR